MPRPVDELDVQDARKLARRRAQAKGYRLQRLVRYALEREGAVVEAARKVVVWRRDPAHPERPPAPLSVKADILAVADFLAMMPDGRRCLVQVTTLENVASHRRRFLQARFPVTQDDVILAHVRGRVFREVRGPAFAMPGRTITLPAVPRAPRAPRLGQSVRVGEVW